MSRDFVRVNDYLFISLDFYNTKAAPIQKTLGSMPWSKTCTSEVIHPLSASTPATPSCEPWVGGKEKEEKKVRRKARSNPLGQPTLLWEEQDLPLMLSYLYPLHLQVRTPGKPRSLVSAHSIATASPSQPGLARASSHPCRTQGCRW